MTDNTIVIGGDLPVHRLGFGAMRLTGEPARLDRATAVAIARRAVELGVTFIDTSVSTVQLHRDQDLDYDDVSSSGSLRALGLGLTVRLAPRQGTRAQLANGCDHQPKESSFAQLVVLLELGGPRDCHAEQTAYDDRRARSIRQHYSGSMRRPIHRPSNPTNLGQRMG